MSRLAVVASVREVAFIRCVSFCGEEDAFFHIRLFQSDGVVVGGVFCISREWFFRDEQSEDGCLRAGEGEVVGLTYAAG